MDFADAIARVRGNTLHDDDTQFEDLQLLPVLAVEYRRYRRWLCVYVPQLCTTTLDGIVLTAGDGHIYKADLLNSSLDPFERLVLIERQSGSTYYAIDAADGLDALTPARISFVEYPDHFLVTPTAEAAGTYRVTFTTGSPDPDDVTEGTNINLPDELYQALVEMGSAWVCNRHPADRERLPYHMKRAETLEREAYSSLRGRYGSHGKSGLRRERRGRY